jgi:hypothetical protein
VRNTLTALGLGSLLDSAELGVTELVTNACLHAGTSIVVTLRVLADNAIRIEVSDNSPRLPEQRHYNAMSTTGRGMRLLESFGRWGVDPAAPPEVGKTVWFEPTAGIDPVRVWDAAALGEWGEL